MRNIGASKVKGLCESRETKASETKPLVKNYDDCKDTKSPKDIFCRKL